jgi:hypothetical protein
MWGKCFPTVATLSGVVRQPEGSGSVNYRQTA